MVNQIPQQPPNKPKAKRYTVGEKFEHQVFTLINRHFPNALKEVYVYINEYRIVEIDVVVVHTSGIYLFEAKVKTGKIFGHPNQTYWTAQHTERKATRFYNPLRQTEAHVRLLAKRHHISPSSCHTIIVFNDGADISEIKFSTNQTTTCTYSDLPHIIRQIKNNRNTPVSPFVLDNIYHDLHAKSGVQQFRDLHKEVLSRKLPKKRQHLHKHR